MSRKTTIEIVWSVEDVQSIAPDLTEDEAIDVLELALKNHDANYGISWETLEMYAHEVRRDAGKPPCGNGYDGGNATDEVCEDCMYRRKCPDCGSDWACEYGDAGFRCIVCESVNAIVEIRRLEAEAGL